MRNLSFYEKQEREKGGNIKKRIERPPAEKRKKLFSRRNHFKRRERELAKKAYI